MLHGDPFFSAPLKNFLLKILQSAKMAIHPFSHIHFLLI
jgi:hypothetical protein